MLLFASLCFSLLEANSQSTADPDPLRQPPSSCDNPTLNIGVSPCCLTNSSLCLPWEENPEVTWNFGDGNSEISSDPVQHCYCEKGIYTVTASAAGYPTTSTFVTITGTCVNPEFTYEITDWEGCTDPTICSEDCDEVTIELTDISTSAFEEETITGVDWDVEVFQSGTLVNTISASGSPATVTINNWNGGTKVVVNQTIYTCLDETSAPQTIKIDCLLSDGENMRSLIAGIESPDEQAKQSAEVQVKKIFSGLPLQAHSVVDKIIIEAPASTHFPKAKYQLVALNGKTVRSGKISHGTHTIPTADLPQGLYVLQLHSGKLLNQNLKVWVH